MDRTLVDPGRARRDEADDANGGRRRSETCHHALRRATASGCAAEQVGHV